MPSLTAVLDRLDADEVRFEPKVRHQLELHGNDLTMLSGVAMQALKVAEDPDCDINEFARVVERDEVLALETLKMANSIRFGGIKTEMNLRRAVVRIGFRQCKSLIIAAGLSSMMKKMKLRDESIREALWRHSLTTAWICLHLNRSLNAGYQGEEFTGALLHDVGRLLEAVCFPDQFSAFAPLGTDETSEILVKEEEAIETNHCELGTWLARKDSLPAPLVDVVRFHHCPERSGSNLRFVALVAACDHMANHLHQFDVVDGYDPSVNSAIPLLESSGVRNATARFSEIAISVMENGHRDALQAMAG